MRKLIQRLTGKVRRQKEPDPEVRRAEVMDFLGRRPSFDHREWQERFAPEIPVEFVAWYRETCSRCFGYDLSGARPEDQLTDDLGMYRATFSDIDMDILEDYESRFGAQLPPEEQLEIGTFGDFLEKLWRHAQEPPPEENAAADPVSGAR
ncbi:MAG: hypothetical protein FJ387_16045 [Verrucomicrobia bacterium]|nr:hypothetical protein [Verrucomicrobiota bacterium]